jgi:flagellar hook-basal body complex protein FliE
MALPISPVVSTPASLPTHAPTGAPAAPSSAFGDALNKLVQSVEDSSSTANQAVGNMLDGTGDVHDAMIALQRAEFALQLTVQVRNKLVQAYQDIMRMPV